MQADISKCANKKCQLKDKCYRYLCQPDEYRQSYAEFKGGKDCDGYWEEEVTNGKKR